ncbi:MAG: hypothetical protein AVDCRST_MAG90-1283 [uncultured Microvirga sp.]|uniref:Uncharacterized protein n=1 Tax=uncultured Microvirga sp. TaxID=412392 RepID=A0A6J4LAH2_9HYPH|nr:MAG: hypothetical protein AVDCRST_MAG90-1283 [uncultured Microvirga sp.]
MFVKTVDAAVAALGSKPTRKANSRPRAFRPSTRLFAEDHDGCPSRSCPRS